MPEKIVVGPVNRGLRTDVTPFNIDNDSFPQLFNAYQWRGRVLRKRGTAILGRLQRFLGVTNGAGALTVTISPVPIPTGIVSFTIGTDIFVDPGTTANPADQILLTNSLGATHTLNRVTGVLTITGSLANTSVLYLPSLPVMGLEEFVNAATQFSDTIGFDTRYAYNIPTASPYTPYDISFYSNPPASALLPGYVPKATPTPLWWNGQDYQQFWTTNYQGALWATNGITVPFSTTNIGMQYGLITAFAITAAGPPAIANITIGAGTTLIIGDFVFINEVTGITGVNFETGYVTNVVGNVVTVEFPNAVLGGAYTGSGIVQYLTNRQDPALDGIRWYDGDPTNGTLPQTFSPNGLGWVNFSPPLSQAVFSIGNLPERQYYLVGARMIVPFKDRLLFIGPVIQSSAAGSQQYLQDMVIYSQNGTPYYTASFVYDPAAPNDPTLATIVFNAILTPPFGTTNYTATAPSWFEDVTGFGGNIAAGVDQPINTVSSNEDVLLLGFDKIQSRFVYTGDDITPFLFFLVNAEYGSGSTFSFITFDKGAFTIGTRGIIETTQTGTQRVDMEILDQVFQFSLARNGRERITAQRDFIKEWIYFTYCDNMDDPEMYRFPNQTLQYNYRDESWAIFDEAYTTYGQFRRRTGLTWNQLILPFTWNTWNDPWNAGSQTLFQPEVIAGNQQGFVLFRDVTATDESVSLDIQYITGNTLRVPNHSLNQGDYIIISGALGAISSQVNGKIFQVSIIVDANNFTLKPVINSTGTDYNGGGLITRMYVPFIQTKQFPAAWGISRKCRIGAQQYLLSTTEDAQITLLIFLSQNSAGAYNSGALFPDPNTVNSSLIYSTVLYTCPESTNLGLTPANTNLQMPTAIDQEQIWHRVNTSLLGDTVQLGFTLSDAQMRDLDSEGGFISQFAEIELHGFIIEVSPSQVLA